MNKIAYAKQHFSAYQKLEYAGLEDDLAQCFYALRDDSLSDLEWHKIQTDLEEIQFLMDDMIDSFYGIEHQ